MMFKSATLKGCVQQVTLDFMSNSPFFMEGSEKQFAGEPCSVSDVSYIYTAAVFFHAPLSCST